MQCKRKITAEIRAILKDKKGRVVKRYPKKMAHSLIKQFIQFLYIQIAQNTLTIKKQDGTDSNPVAHSTNLQCVGAVNDYNEGIVIGTGTNAVAMDDYSLQAKVTTNIAFAAQALSLAYPSASTARISISRTLTNNTGTTLGIREVGLLSKSYNLIFLFDRTLYSVDVPNGYTITFTYTITITL